MIAKVANTRAKMRLWWVGGNPQLVKCHGVVGDRGSVKESSEEGWWETVPWDGSAEEGWWETVTWDGSAEKGWWETVTWDGSAEEGWWETVTWDSSAEEGWWETVTWDGSAEEGWWETVGRGAWAARPTPVPLP